MLYNLLVVIHIHPDYDIISSPLGDIRQICVQVITGSLPNSQSLVGEGKTLISEDTNNEVTWLSVKWRVLGVIQWVTCLIQCLID